MAARRLTQLLCIAAFALMARPATAQPVIWTSGTFTYDGSGNITFTGADAYAYDALSRLTSATADRERTGAVNQQSYTYDSYGNRLTTTTSGIGCMGGCAPNVAVNAYNHLFDHSATYDEAGNLKTFDTFAYEYDGSRMLTRQTTPGGIDWQYIYTADDERVGTYTGQGNWRFTLRDLDGKVLREVTALQSGGGRTWTRDRDHVFRDGQLLATVGVGGGTEHFHLDHLGTPRLVTNASGSTIGIHTYYPFGEELALNFNEFPSETLKFTGHERDVNSINGNSLDYMHARYYNPTVGRFLSVDPEMNVDKLKIQPQAWNRYAYVINNPINRTDPNGRCFWDVCVGEALVGAAILTAATAYVVAPSAVVPGKTNGQVLVDTTIGGFQALGHAVGSLLPGRQPTNLPRPPPPTTPSRPTTPGTQATPGVNPAAPIQASGERNPAQDKLLTNGDIRILQNASHDIHELKGGENASKYDLYKDTAGNVYVKPKGGKGPGDETGINIKDLQHQ